jgi:hypothetical protein
MPTSARPVTRLLAALETAELFQALPGLAYDSIASSLQSTPLPSPRIGPLSRRNMNVEEGTVTQPPSPPSSRDERPRMSQGDRAQSPPAPPDDDALLPPMTVEQLRAVIAVLAPQPAPTIHPQPRERERSAARSPKAAALMAAASTLPKLKEDSYAAWAFTVSDAIKNAGLWDHITGRVARPSPTDTRGVERFVQEAGVVRTVIMGALTHEQSYRYLEGTSTAREAWDALKAAYAKSDGASLMVLDNRFVELNLSEGGDVIVHAASLKNIRRQLAGTQFEVTAARACNALYRSLPPPPMRTSAKSS